MRFVGEFLCIFCTPIITIGVHFPFIKIHLLAKDKKAKMIEEIYRVSFIGHRQIDRFRFVEEQLEKIISDLISKKEYVEFYVGRNGEFDTMVASAVKRCQKAYGTANSSLILIIPYAADLDLLQKFYDEIWYPEELYKVHYKSAITKRNKWFLEHSDLLVAYVEKDKGGAAYCLKQAEKKGIEIKNIALKEE